MFVWDIRRRFLSGDIRLQIAGLIEPIREFLAELRLAFSHNFRPNIVRMNAKNAIRRGDERLGLAATGQRDADERLPIVRPQMDVRFGLFGFPKAIEDSTGVHCHDSHVSRVEEFLRCRARANTSC